MSGLILTTVYLIIPIIFLILIRDIVLWYFRINKRLDLSEKQNKLLEAIFKQLGGEIEEDQTEKENTSEGTWKELYLRGSRKK